MIRCIQSTNGKHSQRKNETKERKKIEVVIDLQKENK
jgi:hypothetical protein